MHAENIYTTEYQSPFGTLVLGSYQGKLCLCDWKTRKSKNALYKKLKKSYGAQFSSNPSMLLEEAKQQLSAYFNGEIVDFNIPLWWMGTPFQQSVWKEVVAIPYGETRSYEEISQIIASEKSVRAVAGANGANAMAIFIPCHRVIGKNNKLTGYSGGLDIKKNLLMLEQRELAKEGNNLFSISKPALSA